MDALQLADQLQDENTGAVINQTADTLRRQYFQVKNLTRMLKETRAKLYELDNDLWMSAHDCLEHYGEKDERDQ
jgi:chromosome condensin MukBEF complex kleisin-like MukF subunit